MKAYKTHHKYPADEISGTFVNPAALDALPSPHSETQETHLETGSQSEAWEELYLPPIAKTTKPHSTKAQCKKRKAQQLATARLTQVSDELNALADSLRYLNPLLAEVLDEAWDATEAAIEMLEGDRGW